MIHRTKNAAVLAVIERWPFAGCGFKWLVRHGWITENGDGYTVQRGQGAIPVKLEMKMKRGLERARNVNLNGGRTDGNH